jgi:prophage regulatory protein
MKKDTMIECFDKGSSMADYRNLASDRSNHATFIGDGFARHAGGPSYKGIAATVSLDCASDVTRADGETVAAAGDDDGDGDGDGDPDSDRALLHPHQNSRYTETLQTALNRKRITTANRILRMAELKTRIGLSRSTIYEFQNSGNFPRSVSLGSRAVGWLESDIEAWMESRINVSKSA